VRLSLFGSGMMIMAVGAQGWLAAQQTNPLSEERMVAVPFVGCKSEGQVSYEAPKRASRAVLVGRDAAQKLAYYETDSPVGVLAPRGWYCLGLVGSSGDGLIVSPKPIDSEVVFSSRHGDLVGPAIAVSHTIGVGSGSDHVARIIARVFPAYRAFAVDEMKRFGGRFTFGPYPTDTLTYKSEKVVEYRTPAHTEGLGTLSWLKKNDSPIEGVAILVGRTPDLLLLAVRLPATLSGLAPAIIREAERIPDRSFIH